MGDKKKNKTGRYFQNLDTISLINKEFMCMTSFDMNKQLQEKNTFLVLFTVKTMVLRTLES